MNSLFKGVNYLAILYVLMTIGMIWRRHDRMDPIVLIFPMFLFALVKVNEETKRWFTCRFIDSWFISFVYVVVKSFIERPYDGFRYYGCFVNIGQFGIFMVCCFTVAIVAMYYSRNNFGRLSLPYAITWLWLLFDLYMLYIINTRTIMVGLIFCLSFLFLFVRKNTSTKVLARRWISIGIFILLILGTGVILLKIINSISYEWVTENYAGTLSPIALTIARFKQMVKVSDNLPLNEQLYSIIDIYSSYRLSIIREYIPYFSYDGSGTVTFLLEKYNYWVFSAHNAYVQFLVEYGYISFFELMFFVLSSLFTCTKSFLRNKEKASRLLPMLWLAMMLGVWIGEANTFFYPATFFGFIFMITTLNKETAPD